MNQPVKTFSVQASAVTDRGLNERRPLNEDAFLADSERGIFAVADGVGGAEAGEVASQTAIEVLDEAFRHRLDGADVEDLMELAIQRANFSIHKMSQEHAKFSMMATTIVALQVKDRVATIGHVGDSRLYRLTPAGQLIRETEDHSVVEEEVRAGRMTPEQALNHPSKNVISRALGAEDGVDVDMKTIEIEDGTEFLLCTDGITRHVPDYEIRQLLVLNDDLAAICDELKTRCYERGAEDNLTAVLIRVGKPIPAGEREEEIERTIVPETPGIYREPSPAQQTTIAGAADTSGEGLVPPSRIAFPAPMQTESVSERSPDRPLNIPVQPATVVESNRTFSRGAIFLLFLVGIAGAFYAGARLKDRLPFLTPKSIAVPQPTATPVMPEDPILKFERARREVDQSPAQWLTNQAKTEIARQGIQNPLDSTDPEFLYLYGRASLLTGNNEEAAKAFDQAITKADLNSSPTNSTVRKEATLGLSAVSLKSPKNKWKALGHYEEMLQKSASSGSP